MRVTVCRITFDPIDDWMATLPAVDRSRLEEIHGRLKSPTARDISELEQLASRYPAQPSLGNWLAVVYQASGDGERSVAQIEANHQRFPDYLFARIGYAELLARRDEAHRIPEAFNGKLDLKQLYPDRDVFHISEATAFLAMIGAYWCAIGKLDRAENVLETLVALDADDRTIETLRLRIRIAILEPFVVPRHG